MSFPNLINKGDIIDLIYEIRRKGMLDVLHRFGFTNSERVIHNWECIDKGASDWWIIPMIRKRWNYLISGNAETEYEDYVVEKYFGDKNNLKLLSVGSGGGTTEIKFAAHNCFSEVRGFDISKKIVAHANQKFDQHGLKNLKFFVADVYKYDFGKEQYDAVLFHSSLHHFNKLDFILEKAKNALKQNGILIINEYVGPDRFQWSTQQLEEVNKILLNDMPHGNKEKRIKGYFKKKVYRPGLLRMFFADPSESVCSSAIPFAINKYFSTVEEKQLGGNLLHPLLKDIAHHYLNENENNINLLNSLIEKEERFLNGSHKSDMLFGIYKK